MLPVGSGTNFTEDGTRLSRISSRLWQRATPTVRSEALRPLRPPMAVVRLRVGSLPVPSRSARTQRTAAPRRLRPVVRGSGPDPSVDRRETGRPAPPGAAAAVPSPAPRAAAPARRRGEGLLLFLF